MAEQRSFEDTLTLWQEKSEQLKTLRAEESALRKSLFDAAFPEEVRKEGVNKITLQGGRVFKATWKINRAVDEAELPGITEELQKLGEANVLPDLFSIKYSLGTRIYKGLTEEIRKIIDRAIITKPGYVSLEVE